MPSTSPVASAHTTSGCSGETTAHGHPEISTTSPSTAAWKPSRSSARGISVATSRRPGRPTRYRPQSAPVARSASASGLLRTSADASRPASSKKSVLDRPQPSTRRYATAGRPGPDASFFALCSTSALSSAATWARIVLGWTPATSASSASVAEPPSARWRTMRSRTGSATASSTPMRETVRGARRSGRSRIRPLRGALEARAPCALEAARHLGRDDRLGAARLERPAGSIRVGCHAKVVDVEEDHALEARDRRLDVARHRQVEADERPAAASRERAGGGATRQHRLRRAGARDDEVCPLELGRQRAERRGAAADLGREAPPGRLRAVADHGPLDAVARERARHRRRHRAGADDERGLAVQVAERAPRERHADGGRRYGAAPDAGLAPHAPARRQRVTEGLPQRSAQRSLLAGDVGRAANLVLDLGLADHERVEPRGDSEQMRERVIARARESRRGDRLGVEAAARGERFAERLDGAGRRGDRVQLRAVAVDSTAAAETAAVERRSPSRARAEGSVSAARSRSATVAVRCESPTATSVPYGPAAEGSTSAAGRTAITGSSGTGRRPTAPAPSG